MSVRKWRDGLWTVDVAHAVLGVPLGARSTLVRLPDERLALLSPVRLSDEDLAAVRAAGEVAYIVAPNLQHYRFVPDARRLFPGARVLAAPGLRRKRPALPIDAELDAEAIPGLPQEPVGGMPKLNEVAFRAGDTLILTDLCFNVRETPSWLFRLYLRRSGALGRLKMTSIARGMIKDREAFARSRAVLVGWACDRVIVTHGDVLAAGGATALPEALAT